ncbi:MAG: hypothetical protein KDA75_02150 [Planctomycetaceae bacterium]|nr:hypothetical protein [Planctomycetaceae bacterium]
MNQFARISCLTAVFSIGMAGFVQHSWGGDRSDVSEVSVLTADGVDETVALGQRIFEHNFGLPHTWKGAEPLGQGGDGLGPQFNDVSCVACHRDGGVGGGGPVEKNAMVLNVIVPQGLNETQLRSVVREAHRQHSELSDKQINTALHRFGLPAEGDERPYAEYLATLFDRLRLGPDQAQPVRASIGVAAFEIAQRNTTALWGAGLIDELRRNDGNGIRRHLMEEQNRRYPWLSGRIPRDSRQREGWFGWRGQMVSLHEFNLGACATELGLTVPGMPQHHSPVAAGELGRPALDLTHEQCLAVTAFVSSLPAPRQVIPADSAAADRVALGEEVFNRCHCNACHVRDLGWVPGIFSDLLLHDMGPGLCDEHEATAEIEPGEINPEGFGVDTSYYGKPVDLFKENPPKVIPTNCECEWRTPPLWGCADTAPYLHDGRASSFEEAIRWHGGEGETSRRAYEALPPDEHSLLIGFLESLRAPQDAPFAGGRREFAAVPQRPVPPQHAPARPGRPQDENAAGFAAADPAAPVLAEVAEQPLLFNDAPAIRGLPPIEPQPTSGDVMAALVELLEGLKPSNANFGRAEPLSLKLNAALPQPAAGDFALALFEKRSLKHSDAMSRLSSIALLRGPYAARARQALVHEDVRRRDYGAAIARLEQHAVEIVDDDSLSPRDAAEQAQWTGLILAWLQGPSGIDPSRFHPEEALQRIRNVFPDHLAGFFDAGVEQVAGHFEALQSERATLQNLVAGEQAAKLDSLALKQNELTSQQSQLEQSRTAWTENFDGTLQKLDQQLAELEKQYLECEETDRRIGAEATPRELRIIGILQYQQDSPLDFRSAQSRELSALQSQLNTINRKREENRANGRIIGLNAQQLLQQRARLVAEYTQKTGQAAKELASIAKWQSRFEKQAEDLGTTPAERSRRVQKLDRQMQELSTYARFDPVDESRLMLMRYRLAE